MIWTKLTFNITRGDTKIRLENECMIREIQKPFCLYVILWDFFFKLRVDRFVFAFLKGVSGWFWKNKRDIGTHSLDKFPFLIFSGNQEKIFEGRLFYPLSWCFVQVMTAQFCSCNNCLAQPGGKILGILCCISLLEWPDNQTCLQPERQEVWTACPSVLFWSLPSGA